MPYVSTVAKVVFFTAAEQKIPIEPKNAAEKIR